MAEKLLLTNIPQLVKTGWALVAEIWDIFKSYRKADPQLSEEIIKVEQCWRTACIDLSIQWALAKESCMHEDMQRTLMDQDKHFVNELRAVDAKIKGFIDPMGIMRTTDFLRHFFKAPSAPSDYLKTALLLGIDCLQVRVVKVPPGEEMVQEAGMAHLVGPLKDRGSRRGGSEGGYGGGSSRGSSGGGGYGGRPPPTYSQSRNGRGYEDRGSLSARSQRAVEYREPEVQIVIEIEDEDEEDEWEREWDWDSDMSTSDFLRDPDGWARSIRNRIRTDRQRW
ncbi:hypothetical protein G7Y89_g5840 [Cudoniella acicularis]|uniref:Uncharacterized protein n=1 Tax=Cudoniella acicularis TaxID=354080 RepID=A0A8H4W640_9HELO|nr:hypothetical protein G7Y89_g5840 [Cudoniella acicularis]